MYNHNVPTQLKSLFDLAARARATINCTGPYPLGLEEGVSALVFSLARTKEEKWSNLGSHLTPRLN